MVVFSVVTLAVGLPHFMGLRNGGPDGPERERGEQRGGREMSPAQRAGERKKR